MHLSQSSPLPLQLDENLQGFLKRLQPDTPPEPAPAPAPAPHSALTSEPPAPSPALNPDLPPVPAPEPGAEPPPAPPPADGDGLPAPPQPPVPDGEDGQQQQQPSQQDTPQQDGLDEPATGTPKEDGIPGRHLVYTVCTGTRIVFSLVVHISKVTFCRCQTVEN